MALFGFLLSSKNKNHEKHPKSDAELLVIYRINQDKSIIGELFNRYTHLVYGICLKYLKNDHAAREAVMQIFEKLLTDLQEHEISHFKSWLYTVSRNHCLMELRKYKASKEQYEKFLQESATENMESDDFSHLNEENRSVKRHQRLHEALKKLKKEQETCVRLMYLENKSYREVSELTGYNMKEVKSYIQNGKRNLEKILKSHGT